MALHPFLSSLKTLSVLGTIDQTSFHTYHMAQMYFHYKFMRETGGLGIQDSANFKDIHWLINVYGYILMFCHCFQRGTTLKHPVNTPVQPSPTRNWLFLKGKNFSSGKNLLLWEQILLLKSCLFCTENGRVASPESIPIHLLTAF